MSSKAIVKMEKEIFEGKLCEECRQSRRKFQYRKTESSVLRPLKGNDRKYYFHGIRRCSDLLVGIYSESCKPPVDVLLVTFGHGGGPWKEEPLSFGDMKTEIEKHYRNKGKYIETFHQFAIREVLDRLDKSSVSWYLTDLIKCYVHTHNKKGRKNKSKAIEYCKNYFEKQVNVLKPKVIVLFGGDVQKGIFESVKGERFSNTMKEVLKNEPIRHLRNRFVKSEGHPQASMELRFGFQYFSHGETIERRIFGHRTKIMFSVFPTGSNAANLWVATNFKNGSSSQHRLVQRIVSEAKSMLSQ